MSTIAKIFTVLNVILAAAFLGWAANAVQSTNDYKRDLEKKTAEYDGLSKQMGEEKSALSAKLKQSDEEVTRLREAVQSAQNENKRIDDENKSNAQTLATIQADYKKIAGTLEGMQADAKAAHESQLKAQTAQHEAESKAKDATTAQMAAEAKASGLENDLIAARQEIANKEKALNSAEKDREKVKTQLATLVQASGINVSSIKAMPAIDGKVLAVEMGVEPGLVSINKGKTAGVERGFTFEIFEGSTYKGQARVEYVYDDMCSAVLVRKVKGETIHQGDGAATHL